MKTHLIDHEWFALSESPLERDKMLALLDAKIDQVNQIADIIDIRQGREVTERALSRATLLGALLSCKDCLKDVEPNFHADVFWGRFAYATAMLMDAEKRIDLFFSPLEL
ncbi:hypothetical protein O5O45_26335 [Hahella aquimaris]|uniref:hypothetical protein n=1 Tax=Hahella sp. HNIBRBA332 TaxID=3015983 RepID=UPI00273C4798|nr:hypothetical protein [Hahella sp. HNIBRBA332]WLQ13253.1 hypothetical protein O5O45_26335 [Hahella sp. HNIBRBA332]